MGSRVRVEGPVVGTYAALATLLPAEYGPVIGEDDLRAAICELCAFVDTRRDCADFRVVALLAVLLGGKVPEASLEQVTRSLLGFKYWMSEPGDDAMCFWSENHQLLFAAGEYLVGATFPDETFSNDRRTGEAHRESAKARLLTWLDLRFRYGFSEWLSPVYYEEDVAGLSLLVDHAPDAEVAERAAVVLDLLLLDCALHRSAGCFAASSGRLYASQKAHPATSEMQPIVDLAFTDRDVVADWNRIGTMFALRQTYEVPAVLREIAADEAPRVVRTGHGLTIAEAVRIGGDLESTATLLWGMEAFATPRSIRPTMAAFHAWRMASNPFLSALSGLDWVLDPLRPWAVRISNPVVAGTALERAQVVSTRSSSYLLSAAQHYRPGGFGDQQHLWHVLLEGVPIFATHPGGPVVDDATRQKTPSAWVGNGVNPDVASEGPVLLAVYDTRVRRGLGEAKRVKGSHLYVPFAELDESAQGGYWLAARKGSGLVGVIATSPLIHESDTSVRQEGPVTGWVVVCAELRDHGSLDEFCTWLARCSVILTQARLNVTTPLGAYQLDRGRLAHDGVRVEPDTARYDTEWIQAPYNAAELVIEGRTSSLVLTRSGGRRALQGSHGI